MHGKDIYDPPPADDVVSHSGETYLPVLHGYIIVRTLRHEKNGAGTWWLLRVMFQRESEDIATHQARNTAQKGRKVPTVYVVALGTCGGNPRTMHVRQPLGRSSCGTFWQEMD